MIYPALITILLGLYAVLAWKNLRLALIMLTGLLPIYLLRFEIGPFPSTTLEVMILIAIVVWILQRKTYPFSVTRVRPWILPGLLLLAAASFGVTVAPDTFGALGVWKAYFVEPLIVFVLLLTVLKKDDWSKIIFALALSSLVISIAAILQYITGLGIPTPWDLERRATGLFEYPNALGLYLVPIITLLIVRAGQAKRHWIEYTAIVLGLIAIILAKTEAAYVAIPAALIITFFLSNKRKQLKLRVGVELIIVAALIFALIPVAREKLPLQDASGQVRLSQWSETTQLLLDQPAFGAGLNAYPQALEPYHDDTLYEIYQYPHTLIFNIWSELGLLGLVAFLWLAFLVAKTTWRHRKRPEVLTIFAALLAMTIHGLVDVPYFKNDLSVLTWVLIALLVVQTKQPRKATFS